MHYPAYALPLLRPAKCLMLIVLSCIVLSYVKEVSCVKEARVAPNVPIRQCLS